MFCWSFHCIFQPQDEEQEFIVGDNSSVTGGFWNLPLTPGRWYQVTLVAVNRQDDDYKFSFVKLHHPVQTPSEANVEEEGSSGAVWAALLLLLLIPAVVYFICRSVVWVSFVTAYVSIGRKQRPLFVTSMILFFFFTTTAKMSLKLTLLYLQSGPNILAHRVYCFNTLYSSLLKQF